MRNFVNTAFVKSILLAATALLFFQCTSKDANAPLKYNEAFNRYITAFTDFEISRKTPIIVRFTEDKAQANEIGKNIQTELMTIEPAVKGVYRWSDAKTLEFRPQDLLPNNQSYRVSVKIKDLFEKVPDSLALFEFNVKTKQQFFKVSDLGLKPGDNNDIKTQNFLGEIASGDFEPHDKVKTYLVAEHDGEAVNVVWDAAKDGETRFPFEIKGLKRKKEKSFLKLTFKGTGLSAKDLEIKTVEIPAIGVFALIDHKVTSEPDKMVELEYSDPLDPNQNIEGLIKIKGFTVTTAIEGNVIKVFPRGSVTGPTTITIEKGIRNVIGTTIKETQAFEVTFIELKPEVKLLGSGTIVPKGSILPFPFEAVNLSAVDVRIIKIHENNIPQFLQVNRLEGEYQLKRVGEIIVQKKIVLDNKLNLKEWNKHVIDLSSIVETEPGAIYRVALGFKRDYSLYRSCVDADTIGGNNMMDLGNGWGAQEDQYEDDYYDDYDYYDYDYSWENRDNPCKSAYFHSGRIAEKNILASNLGLISKKGTNDDFFFSVTDLISTEPISGVTLEVYNFQQRLLKTLTTDGNGWANAKIGENPYLLVAKRGKERGYLRLDNGTSLSLSNFDVSGNTYHKGLKGFIYGERGVWRPGDDIFLTFILEDKEKVLPAQYPVTLEFTNPKGQLIKKEVTKWGMNGFYHFKLSTDEDAPTGDYSVKIYAGGSTFHKNIKVETIQPNRLKINFNIADNKISKNDHKTAKLKSTWLHGAVAKNLKADVSVKLTKSTTEFEKFKDYDFDYDGNDYYSSERQVIFEGKLNDNGEADIDLGLESNDDAPGMLRANFALKVFEPGGNFSTDAFSVPYHPYDAYVGIKTPKRNANSYYYATDAAHKMDLALVNTKGEAFTDNSTIEVEVYKLSWRWWWDDGMDQVGYFSTNYHSKHSSHTVNVSKGRGTFNFVAKHNEWGRFLIIAKNEFGHKTSKIIYVDWPGYSRSNGDGESGAKMLSFTANKEKYAVGEDVTLNIPTPEKGKILVSIESGNKVLETQWVNSTGTNTAYTFKAKSDMAPACYAYVMLLQPQGNTSNDLPIRMYGVIPLKVENPQSILKPKIVMANELQPNSDVNVTVSEATGRGMTYTIAMVDEGLLDLTRYTTPDVWTAFNQRQALSVKTWDVFDDVANAQYSKIKNLLSIGGDLAAAGADAKKVNRFKPVVYYAGPFYVPAGSSKTHKIHIPNYVGSVKTMVVAGDNFAYGNAEKITAVKKPLMILGTMPRVVSPGEKISFPVNVFAMKDHVKDVTVTLVQNDLFEVLGEKSKKINFKRQGDQLVFFDLKAGEKTGIAKIKVSAKSGAESATYELSLEVRSPNPQTTESTNKMLSKGTSMEQTVNLFGLAGSNKVTVELSTAPPINLDNRLDYLIHYPYGCIEQTTSSVFPQLYLSKLMKLDGTRKAQIEENVKAGITRLASFQTSDGGFAYWPGNTDANEWGTNYGGHFLVEAIDAGYNVPKDMLKRWQKYQGKMARDFNHTDNWSNDMTQAYRLYVLAKYGSPELGAMNQLKTVGASDKAKWYLAAAYYLAGQRNIGLEITQSLNKDIKEYQQFGHTYGSATRDKAIILEVLTLMKNQHESLKMALEVSKELSSNRWMSTQTTAYALVAMAKFTVAHPIPDRLMADVIINGKKHSLNSELTIAKVIADNMQSSNSIKVVNTSNGSLYVRILNSGVPKADKTTDGAHLMAMDVSYQDMYGKEISPSNIEQGKDFKMIVSVQNKSTTLFLEEVALNAMMPSGWEIHNARMTGIEVGKNDSYEYQDLRDDRVFTFFDLQPNQEKTFTFFLNASYVGEYFQPSILVSPMYDETIYARKKGGIVRVVKQETN
jgi:alpha-2-macroglobulin